MEEGQLAGPCPLRGKFKVTSGLARYTARFVFLPSAIWSPSSSPQQKARDNRAAQRINKVQLSNEPIVKRHAPSQVPPPSSNPLPPQQLQQQQLQPLHQPQPPQPPQLLPLPPPQLQLPPTGSYDPVETELGFKDPLRPRESEQELEWKLRQVGVFLCLGIE